MMLLRQFIAKYFDGNASIKVDPSTILNKCLSNDIVEVDWYTIDIRGWRIIYYIDKRSEQKDKYNLRFHSAVLIKDQSVKCKTIKQLEQYLIGSKPSTSQLSLNL